MPKKLSIEELLKRINERKKTYPELDADLTTYNGYKSKMVFIDSLYGEWLAIPANVIDKKCVHPERDRVKRINNVTNIDEIKNELYKVWGDEVIIVEETYVNKRKKAKFLDKKFGFFWKLVYRVLQGGGCPQRGLLKQSLSSRIDIDEVKKRLKNVWDDDVTINEETYICYSKKAEFISKKYGKWVAIVANVLNGHGHPNGMIDRIKKTNKEKYGYEWATQNKSIQEKIIKSSFQTVKLYHWKTKEFLLCRGSYEYSVVTQLNNLKIDFKWQIPFKLKINGKNVIYICDLYLCDDDKYIEIKGIFKSLKNKAKWDEFHKKYKNSELWQQKEIEEFCKKSRYFLEKDYKKYKNEIEKRSYNEQRRCFKNMSN